MRGAVWRWINVQVSFFYCNTSNDNIILSYTHQYFTYSNVTFLSSHVPNDAFFADLISSPDSLCLRPLDRLRCQQAVLDKLDQRDHQQVQSGWQWAGGARDCKEGVSQRHSSGRDGWVELVTSASDWRRGLLGVWKDYTFNQLSGFKMELFRECMQTAVPHSMWRIRSIR